MGARATLVEVLNPPAGWKQRTSLKNARSLVARGWACWQDGKLFCLSRAHAVRCPTTPDEELERAIGQHRGEIACWKWTVRVSGKVKVHQARPVLRVPASC